MTRYIFTSIIGATITIYLLISSVLWNINIFTWNLSAICVFGILLIVKIRQLEALVKYKKLVDEMFVNLFKPPSDSEGTSNTNSKEKDSTS